MTWFCDKCKETNPDVYVVGENWDDDSKIQEIFKSGIDSQFAFKFSQSSGTLTTEVIAQRGTAIAKKVMKYNDKMYNNNENYIPTMFMSNHDMVRSGNSLEPKGLSYQKMAASVYMLFPGNPFIYYGEEIGITAPNTTSDSAYRTPMIFDSNNLPNIWVNGVGDVAKWRGAAQRGPRNGAASPGEPKGYHPPSRRSDVTLCSRHCIPLHTLSSRNLPRYPWRRMPSCSFCRASDWKSHPPA